jgi:hypothetical protein
VSQTLVGRSRELLRSRTLLRDVGAVVIAGAAGIGKTALAEALAVEWERLGGQVQEFRGTHGLRQVPFGTFASRLRVGMGETATELAARIMQSIVTSSEEPLVWVDDADLVDSQSAGLLAGLGTQPGVHLLLTVTSGSPVPADVAGLWARRPECRIELQPLNRDQVSTMATGILGFGPEPEQIDTIMSITLGYPLYVSALLIDARERQGDEADSIHLSFKSDRLTSLFERRLVRLGREERRLFDLIAFAESLPVSEVTDDTLAFLESSDLIRNRSGRFEVAHPLLASVAASTLTVDGRRECARELLARLPKAAAPSDVAEAVRKALAAGVLPSETHLETAARWAFDWQDFAAAARIASFALESPSLATLRAKARRYLGEVPDEIPIELDDTSLTDLVSTRSQAVAYVERRFSEGVAILEEGLARVREPSHRTRLALEMIVLSGLAGDLDSLLGAARAVGLDADINTRLLAESTTLFAEGLTLTTASSDGTYRRGREMADKDVSDPFLVERLEMSRILVDLAEGRLAEARDRCYASPDRATPGSWLVMETFMSDAWSSPTEARDLADSAVSALEVFDPLANLPQARLVAAMRRAQTGDTAVARDLEAVDEAMDPGAADVDRIMRMRVDAWVAWASGDPSAGKLMVAAGQEAIAKGHRLWGLGALIDAARLGKGAVVASDIEQLVVSKGAGLATLAAHHARADTPEEWWSVCRLWWQAGAPTYAIEAAIKAANSGEIVYRAGVQLLAARGAGALIGDISAIDRPLTDRGVDVILGVLDGLSNREIADRLFVSKRTVESHLYNSYRALSLSGDREQLLDLFVWI